MDLIRDTKIYTFEIECYKDETPPPPPPLDQRDNIEPKTKPVISTSLIWMSNKPI
jgi:hypothetical protein